MRFPTLQGVIKRRILVNYRADPEIVGRFLPEPFRPKLFHGFAIAGICLIRLEHTRPSFTPQFIGFTSENAAHRIAVIWERDGEVHEGVYIPRRDTDSALSSAVGGTLFPGEHDRADFIVNESTGRIDLTMHSRDGKVAVELSGKDTGSMPGGSIFVTLLEASRFFESGSHGYSPSADSRQLDGIELKVKKWRVDPLELDRIHSSFYSEYSLFPEGSIEFDHALIMRNIEHEWRCLPDMEVQQGIRTFGEHPFYNRSGTAT